MVKQHAFHRRSRLLNSTEFNRVFEKPARSSDRYFSVLARANALPFSRLGLAVSRKVDQRAVIRNHIKRIVRESFRQEHWIGDSVERPGRYAPPRDYVVLPKRAAVAISNNQMRQSLKDHWQRLDQQLNDTASGAEESPKGVGPESK